MNRHVRCFVLLLMGITFATNAATISDDNVKYKLLLWDMDGQKIEFMLDYGVTITFDDDQLIITNDVADIIPFDLDNTWKLTYAAVGGDGTGVQSLSEDLNTVQFNGQNIMFQHLKAGSKVSVYAVNGMLMMNKTIASDGELTVDLSNFSQGVYVVNVNNKTYKVVKK